MQVKQVFMSFVFITSYLVQCISAVLERLTTGTADLQGGEGRGRAAGPAGCSRSRRGWRIRPGSTCSNTAVFQHGSRLGRIYLQELSTDSDATKVAVILIAAVLQKHLSPSWILALGWTSYTCSAQN